MIENSDSEQIERLNSRVAELLAEVAALKRHALGALTVSDEDWQRALDCAMSCMRPPFHISRSAMDNAMQHAFGILSLSTLTSTTRCPE